VKPLWLWFLLVCSMWAAPATALGPGPATLPRTNSDVLHRSRPRLKPVAVDTLSWLQKIGPPGLFSRPIAVARSAAGDILVLDEWRECIFVVDENGSPVGQFGGAGTSSVVLSRPRDLCVDDLGRIYIADTGNRRVVVLAGDGQLLGVIEAGFEVLSVDAWDGDVLCQTDPSSASGLVDRVSLTGDLIGSIGRVLVDAENPEVLALALNRYYAATRVQGEIIAIARQALPLVELYSAKTGERIKAFQVATVEVDSTRSRYFYAFSENFYANGHHAAPDPRLQDYINDIRCTIVDGGRPTIVQYIAGCEFFGSDICLLVDGHLLLFDLDGNLVRRAVLRGPSGETIYSHRLWISDADEVFTVDKAHEKSVYKFLW